jgi:AcrR family transcriptional regulator
VTVIDADAVRAVALKLFAERGYTATTMADIGAALGVRGPSLYRYLQSKHDLLAEIMVATMTTLLADQAGARSASSDPVLQLRRMVEAHVRFHAGRRDEAFVGNREIDNLQPPARTNVLKLRRRYERTLQSVIIAGIEKGAFQVDSPRLASYAILDMGIGVSAWFRQGGPHTADEVAYAHAEYAVAILGGR